MRAERQRAAPKPAVVPQQAASGGYQVHINVPHGTQVTTGGAQPPAPTPVSYAAFLAEADRRVSRMEEAIAIIVQGNDRERMGEAADYVAEEDHDQPWQAVRRKEASTRMNQQYDKAVKQVTGDDHFRRQAADAARQSRQLGADLRKHYGTSLPPISARIIVIPRQWRSQFGSSRLGLRLPQPMRPGSV